MATTGVLAELLAEKLNMKTGTVNFYGQALRDAGLLTKGGRGLSAAQMTIVDAVHWLVALVCSPTADAVAGTVYAICDLKLRDADIEQARRHDRSLQFLHADSVGALLVSLFEDQKAGRLEPVAIDLEFLNRGEAVILEASRMHEKRGAKWSCRMVFGSIPDSDARIAVDRFGGAVLGDISEFVQ